MLFRSEGVEFLKSYDIVVHPRCKNLINELENYKYKVDPLTGMILPVLADKDNHVIDACRYALEGARRTVRKIEETKPLDAEPHYYGGQGWMGV